MKKYLLYIDILGFKELVRRQPSKVGMLYRIIDSLNVHAHSSFKTIVFSDTILVYNTVDASSEEMKNYLVMYAVEFAQDLQYRLTGQNIFFRAILVWGEFDHYNLENVECFYGPALIDAYLREQEIPAVGLFIDDAANANNRIFKTAKVDKGLHFVFVNQALDQFSRDAGGKLPVGLEFLRLTEHYDYIIPDVNYLKSIHRNMKLHQNSVRVRGKYLATWHLYRDRYPGILDALEAKNFSPKAICADFDWSEQLKRYRESVAYFRALGMRS